MFLHSFKALLFSSLLALSSCFGGGHYAPVAERQQPITTIPNKHKVVRGETLYSIAWRYGMDFNRLAGTNEITPPFIIYPGQILQLKNTSAVRRPLSKKTARQRAQQKNPVASPANRSASIKTEKSLRPLDKSRYPFRWQWPATGKMIRTYSSTSGVHKGIDIKGKLGESVRAANSGKVVYAGSGLVGYGKLLIIKHDKHYLSAYGHNRKLLVREGALIKVGQRIAEFGDSGTDSVKLHFEIRRDGKPINPLSLLPRG